MATIEELQKQMQANSAAWHSADNATRDSLHQQNVALQKQIDAMTGGTSSYNAASGTWNTTPAQTTPTQTGTMTTPAERTSLGAYDQFYMTSADQQAIAALKQQYEAQKAAGASDAVLQGINAQANAIRGGYGYSGGVTGNEYIKLLEEEQAKAATPSYSAPTLPSATSQESYVNRLYDAYIEQQIADLKAAYEANQIELNAAAATIPQQYQAARNAAAASYEQQQRNAAEFAAAAGLNTGAAAQQNLALGAQYQGNLSDITTTEQATLADLELQRTQLATAYNNAIAQAKAEGNYERAAALYQEAVRVDNSIVETALNQANLDYQQYLAAYNSFRDTQEMNYQNALFEYQQQQDAIANQMALAELQAQLQKNTATNTGSSGSTSVYADLQNANVKSEADAYAYLVKKGYSSTEAKNLASYYMDKADSGELKTANTANATLPTWDGINKAQVISVLGAVSPAQLDAMADAGQIELYTGKGGLIEVRKVSGK